MPSSNQLARRRRDVFQQEMFHRYALTSPHAPISVLRTWPLS